MATNRTNEFVVVDGATGAFTSSDMQNLGYRGVLVFINVESVSVDSITVTVEGKSNVGSDEYYTILTSAAIGSAGLTVLEIYPGIAETANVSVNTVMPANWRITAAVGGGGSYDYDIGFVYIP